MGSLSTSILFGVAMILLLGLSIGLQVFRTRRSLLGKVVGLLTAVKYNEKLIENFSYHRGIGRMRDGSWEKNREKLRFLPRELDGEITKVFGMVAEINEKINAARRHGTDAYMASIEVDKLKVPLATCREQLQTWIYDNMNNPEYLPKRRRLFKF
ncbi:MAG: hypothetical protein ABID71_05370 [Chloroflexota bacterium]